MKNRMNFRIWDKALNKWVEDYCAGTHAMTETYLTLTGEVVKFSAGFPDRDEQPLWGKDSDDYFHNGKWHRTEERYVVQRGTGMKDVRGKEIFEGDIVKAGESIAQVSYFDGAFWAEWELGNTLLLTYQWKVIGNIFENADLIK